MPIKKKVYVINHLDEIVKEYPSTRKAAIGEGVSRTTIQKYCQTRTFWTHTETGFGYHYELNQYPQQQEEDDCLDEEFMTPETYHKVDWWAVFFATLGILAIIFLAWLNGG